MLKYTLSFSGSVLCRKACVPQRNKHISCYNIPNSFMFKIIRKKLGFFKRGILGFFQNKMEKFVPHSNAHPNTLQFPHTNIHTLPHPPELNLFEIGRSVKNKPIRCFQIGSGKTKLLYAFGIHGNEVGTVKLAGHFLKWINEHLNELNKITLFIVPCLNPDGFSLALQNPDYFSGGKIGRLNANNVDLNRNFATKTFQKESVWYFSEKIKVYCGEHGNSEPETKALTGFIEKNDIKILFMFHNAGKEVMGNKNTLSQKLTKLFCEKSGFHYVSDEDWAKLNQTGTAKEWCDEKNIAYIEVEGSARWGSDWKNQKEAIISVMRAA